MELVKTLIASLPRGVFAHKNKEHKTALDVSIEKRLDEVTTLFLETPACLAEIDTEKLIKYFCHFAEIGDVKLAKLILEKRPDIISKEILDLLIADEKPNEDVIRLICHSKEVLGHLDDDKTSELTTAVNHQHFSIVDFLLTKAAEKYQWNEIDLAIQCLLQRPRASHAAEELISKVNLLTYVRKYATGAEVEKREYVKKLVINVIEQARSAQEIMMLVNHLAQMERDAPFLTPRRGALSFMFRNQWQGHEISKCFLSLLLRAKTKIRSLPNDFQHAVEVRAFLKEPTNGYTKDRAEMKTALRYR